MKKDLYIDFDSTIVNADKAISMIYNRKYKDYEGFKPAIWSEHTNWAYKHMCPLIHVHEEDPRSVVKDYFNSEELFTYLEFYEDAKEVIGQLVLKYNVIIATSAFPMNASRKVMWIEENLPEVEEVLVLINKSSHGYGKERVPMMEEGSIFIDDHPNNLHSTKASRKYLFKLSDTDYNGGWDGAVFSSWKQIGETLL